MDVQRDFCPGGSLAVRDGDSIVPELNRVIDAFDRSHLPIFFTRDLHPPNHISFKERNGPWPPHCVQGTPGSGFCAGLHVPPTATIISKGRDPDEEAYSGFQGTDLGSKLEALDVSEVAIGGLATDYCVKETSLDAIRRGLVVDVMRDCVMAVDQSVGDGRSALNEMARSGANLITSDDAIRRLAGAQQ